MKMPIEDALREKGWFLKSDVISELSTRMGSNDVSIIHGQLLNLDIRKRGCGALPEDVLTKKSGNVRGPLIVQISEVVDVSQPSYSASKAKDGILCCTVHDGRVSGSAVTLDSKTCPLTIQTAPGTKVLLKNTKIEHGMLILDTTCVEVLGGRVDAIAEAWEAQLKYSCVKRITKAEINSVGPVFSQFDPTMTTQSVKGNFSMAIRCDPPESLAVETGKLQHLSKSYQGATNDTSCASGQTSTAGSDVKTHPLANTEAAASLANAATVKEKLRNKMLHDAAAYEARGGGRGIKGRGRGRRGRRRGDEEDESRVMTMEQWEARKSGRGTVQAHSIDSDEQLARQLQGQLNAEAAAEAQAQQGHDPGAGAAEPNFYKRHAEQSAGGRGGRGGRRERRGSGRGPR